MLQGKWAVVVIILILAVTPAFAGGAAEEEVVDEVELTFVDQNYTYTRIAAAAFKDYVERESDGAISVTTLPWEPLGDDREVTDQLRLGEIEMYVATTGGLAGVIPEVQMTNLPFLFTDRHAAWRLFEDEDYLDFVQNWWLESSNGQIRLLGAAENSVRNLYSTRGPIRVPGDLAEYDITMRVPPVPMYVDLFEGLGAPSIESVPAAERYTALQTGMIDATEGGLASAWEAGLMEVQDYVTLTGHMFDHHYYIINNEFYESLSPELQQIIEEGIRIATWAQNITAMRESERALDLMRDEGITVHEPTQDEIAQWQEIGIEVGERILSEDVPQDYMSRTLAAAERVHAELDMEYVQSRIDEITALMETLEEPY